MLDVNLAGEKAFPIADALAERGVPFVYATGYGRAGLRDEDAARPVVQKPYSTAGPGADPARRGRARLGVPRRAAAGCYTRGRMSPTLVLPADAWTPAPGARSLVTVGLFASIAAGLPVRPHQLGVRDRAGAGALARRLRRQRRGACPAAIAVFTLAAFVGAPQFLLIAACVVAFGPWFGLPLRLGRDRGLGGGHLLRRPAGRRRGRCSASAADGLNRLSRLRRHATPSSGSFIIRNVPSAPFIVVNMAFGVSQARFPSFLAGCALGVLPKTALVAFFGGSFMTAVAGDGVWTSAILAGVGRGLAGADAGRARASWSGGRASTDEAP